MKYNVNVDIMKGDKWESTIRNVPIDTEPLIGDPLSNFIQAILDKRPSLADRDYVDLYWTDPNEDKPMHVTLSKKKKIR